jgi:hypothetical protein
MVIACTQSWAYIRQAVKKWLTLSRLYMLFYIYPERQSRPPRMKLAPWWISSFNGSVYWVGAPTPQRQWDTPKSLQIVPGLSIDTRYSI